MQRIQLRISLTPTGASTRSASFRAWRLGDGQSCPSEIYCRRRRAAGRVTELRVVLPAIHSSVLTVPSLLIATLVTVTTGVCFNALLPRFNVQGMRRNFHLQNSVPSLIFMSISQPTQVQACQMKNRKGTCPSNACSV